MTIFTLGLWIACSPLQEGYTEQGHYYIVFDTNPDPIPFKEYFDVTVGVFSDRTDTEPLTDVEIIVDATMPQHEHGMNVAPSHSIDDAGYTVASGLEWFMMGEWQLEFYITPQTGGPTETAFFLIECCEQ